MDRFLIILTVRRTLKCDSFFPDPIFCVPILETSGGIEVQILEFLLSLVCLIVLIKRGKHAEKSHLIFFSLPCDDVNSVSPRVSVDCSHVWCLLLHHDEGGGLGL
jgi:hypothetical protein